MNKTPLIIIAAIILAAVIFLVWYSVAAKPLVNPVPIPDGIILFYGNGCPHCKIVDDFVAQNNIEEKVKFSHLEVWYSKENQNILAQVVRRCGITGDSVGVPLLWDGLRCYIGDVDIINFFKNK